MTGLPSEDIVHASAVAIGGSAVLIRGKSGSGKSSLALEMMARGATLVADDRVVLTRQESRVFLSSPETIRGRIEARGFGILHADYREHVPLALIVQMDVLETERIPPDRQSEILGIRFPLVHNVASAHFPAAIVQYLKSVEAGIS